MTVHIEVSIGTHQIQLWPEGESLRCVMTWHKTVVLHDWSLGRLIAWANDAANDDDYIAAERRFIELATGSKEAAQLGKW